MAAPLNILIVATKPPWPPVDGGRVVVLNTIDALAAAGHRITLVAPVDPTTDLAAARDALASRCRPELVPVPPLGMRTAALSALLRGHPLTVERHRFQPSPTGCANWRLWRPSTWSRRSSSRRSPRPRSEPP